MTRRKRKEDFGTIDAWLERKALLRRKKIEADRKRAAEKLNTNFQELMEDW